MRSLRFKNKKMKNKWRILKILVTVVIFGFLLSFSLKRFNEKPLDDISVKMSDKSPVYFVDEKDIKTIVERYNTTKKVGDIDIPSLEKKLNELPAVDSANVYLSLDGKLHLDILQRVPVFRLNNGGKGFYVDKDGTEFPISKNYSHPCMLVSGDVKKKEYLKLVELIDKIDKDSFCKNYFAGITKENGNFNLITNEGLYKVELGDLDHIEFKIKGFKTFVEKFLVNQNPEKYSKISVKYDNQIVTTLNNGYKPEEDSLAIEKPKEISEKPLEKEKAKKSTQKEEKKQ